MKSAIYARQSIDKPDSLSIEGQIDLCRRECTFDDVEIFRDAGYSGKNTHRPDFERLMAAVEAGEIGQLVCYRLDRISRNIVDFGRIWETLSAHKVEFSSVSERFDTSTSIGRAMVYIIMIFAQMERETIAERVRDNYYQRVKKGAWPGGPAPYGCRIVRRDGQAALEHTDDIGVVREIFALYAAPGASLGKVAKILNERGIPCAQRAAWDNVSLARLLHNPVYAACNVDVMRYYQQRGTIICNPLDEFDGSRSCVIIGKRTASERKYTDVTDHTLVLTQLPGVIPAADFLAVQRKLDSNRQLKRSGSGQYTWLSGLLKCGHCGYALQAHMDRDYNVVRLTCSGRTHFGAAVCGERHSERLPAVEAQVLATLQQRLTELSEQQESGKPASDTAHEDELRLEQAKIEQKISGLLNALSEASGITTRYVNQELARLDARLREISDELTVSPMPLLPVGIRSMNLTTLTFDERRALARSMIRAVRCTTDSVVVEWV